MKTANNVRMYDRNLFGEARKPFEWSLQKTVEDMQMYDATMHWVIAYSGGKDSSAVVTLVADLIEKGQITAPKSLTVIYADTGMECPPLHVAALKTLDILSKSGIQTQVVRPALDERFFVYMFGRGVPPPNNGFRWCTDKLKLRPMKLVMEVAAQQYGERFVLLTGVRQGESAARDERLSIACSKDGAECGQGRLYVDKKANRLSDTMVPILHWRVCHVWDWLTFHVPARFAEATRIVAEIYGGDEARENNARTGCMECPLVGEDTMMQYVISLPQYAYLAPIRRLRTLYEELRKPANRLRREARPGDYPLGPLTMDARRYGLSQVLAIQDEVNSAAARVGADPVSLIDEQEHMRILTLIDADTWPNNWSGHELRGDLYKIPAEYEQTAFLYDDDLAS